MARFNKYDYSTFSHVYDRDARIVVTQPPQRRSRENPNPNTLAYGHYIDNPSVVRAFMDEELVTLPEHMPAPKVQTNRRKDYDED